MIVLPLFNSFRFEYSSFSIQCDFVLISSVCLSVPSYSIPGIFLTCMFNTFYSRQDRCLPPIFCVRLPEAPEEFETRRMTKVRQMTARVTDRVACCRSVHCTALYPVQ